MTRTKSKLPRNWTLADLVAHLGGIGLERIRVHPPVGTATEDDLLAIETHEDRPCDLIDGVLVEKVSSFVASALTSFLGMYVGTYVDKHDLGCLTAVNGPFRLRPGLVRMPDLAFVEWKQLPGKKYPKEPIADFAPPLAAEVLCDRNTEHEMRLKLTEYFEAGVRLVWYIDPDKRTAKIYTAPDEVRELSEADSLDGGDVLPGFSLPLAELFRYVEPKAPVKKKGANGGRKRNGR